MPAHSGVLGFIVSHLNGFCTLCEGRWAMIRLSASPKNEAMAQIYAADIQYS
jgi:hypothetical protein